MKEDVSFDGRAQRFVERIYGSHKGALRLEPVWQHMLAHIPQLQGAVARCWDAGGGTGQIALRLAALGHQVLLNDLSGEMLALARDQLQAAGAIDRVTLAHCPIQAVTEGEFDVVVCHAVLEWVVDQAALIATLAARLAPGGRLSLMFYNRDALIMTHAIKGNVGRLLRGELAGHPGGLTPPNAAEPAAVADLLAASNLVVCSRQGIRSVSDFLPKSVRNETPPTSLLELENLYGGRSPFRELARYQHWVCARLQVQT